MQTSVLLFLMRACDCAPVPEPDSLCRLQVEDYSKRKGQELEFTQKWLSPMLKCAFRKN